MLIRKRNAVLIFNPKSGRGKATLRAKDFADNWKAKTGNELRLRATRSLEDIRVASRETYSNDDNELQIFMGGDGTLSESLQGVAERNRFRPDRKPVGFLPGGTGNSFLRDFGITTYERARDCLLTAIELDSILNIDVNQITYNRVNPENPGIPGEETNRISFNIWGIGLISDITELAIRMRSIGALNYSVASIAKLLSHTPWEAKVKIDGEEQTLMCNMITVSNSRYTGGAMEIAPQVRVNDGKLFLIVTQFQSRLKLLTTFPVIFKGKHVDNPHILTRFIREFSVERKPPFIMNIDGELETGFNPRLAVRPGFFRLFMPLDRLDPHT